MNEQHPVNLRIPGPTVVPAEILQEMSRPMINHRGPEFAAILGRVTDGLKYFYQTTNDVLTFPASGTGGLEAAIVNLFSPGDNLAVISIGFFGERFAKIASAFGANVTRIDFPFGQAADPKVVKERLAAIPQLKGILVTHNETSTGVMNDIAALVPVFKNYDVAIAVDAVSSLSCVDLPVDQLGLDVVVTGSQKGWMAPPGMAMVSISRRGWEYNRQAKMPRYYWDFALAKKSLDKGETPYTPAISTFYALDKALAMMRTEGLQATFARHTQVAGYTRQRVKALGLELFADEAHASNTVTAVKVPATVDGKKLLKSLREEDKVVLAGGQGDLAGKIFRIGHLGWVHQEDIVSALDAVERQLARQSFAVATARQEV